MKIYRLFFLVALNLNLSLTFANEVNDTISISKIFQAQNEQGLTLDFEIKLDYSSDSFTSKGMFGVDIDSFTSYDNIELKILTPTNKSNHQLIMSITDEKGKSKQANIKITKDEPINLSSLNESSSLYGIKIYNHRTHLNFLFISDQQPDDAYELKDVSLNSVLSAYTSTSPLYENKFRNYSSADLISYFIALYTNGSDKVNKHNELLFNILNQRNDFELLIEAISKNMHLASKSPIYPLKNDTFVVGFKNAIANLNQYNSPHLLSIFGLELKNITDYNVGFASMLISSIPQDLTSSAIMKFKIELLLLELRNSLYKYSGNAEEFKTALENIDIIWNNISRAPFSEEYKKIIYTRAITKFNSSDNKIKLEVLKNSDSTFISFIKDTELEIKKNKSLRTKLTNLCKKYLK